MDEATQVNRKWWNSAYGTLEAAKNILQYNAVMHRQLVEYALRKAPPIGGNCRVLDVGFGNGANLFLFPPTCALHGVELSTSAVNLVKAEANRRGYHAADLRIPQDPTLLPYGDDTFDFVICCHLIEHLESDMTMFAEIKRVLRPEGVAILQIPIDLFDAQVHSDSVLLNPAFAAGLSYHVRRYNAFSCRARLESAGFNIVDEMVCGVPWDLLMKIDLKFRAPLRRVPGWGKMVDRVLSIFLNVPLALLPFRARLFLDKALGRLGFHPRYGQWVVSKHVSR